LILNRAKQIVCYHDDDAEPEIGFDVYDWKGVKISSFPIQDDILALKISEDERYLALALTQGQVLILNASEFKVLGKAKVSGEIIDLDLSSGEVPKVAVLFSKPTGSGSQRKQQIQVLESSLGNLKPLGGLEPSSHVDQIRLVGQKNLLFAYGNGEGGQALLAMSPLSNGIQELWSRGDRGNTHHTPQMFSFQNPPQVVTAYEDRTQVDRQSRIVSWDFSGKLRWQLFVKSSLGSDEGAYLYSQTAQASNADTLSEMTIVFATDDGMLGCFQESSP
jgi:hypothetical protein